jgi:hypothetical protein
MRPILFNSNCNIIGRAQIEGKHGLKGGKGHRAQIEGKHGLKGGKGHKNGLKGHYNVLKGHYIMMIK